MTQHERPVYTHEEYINLVLRSGHIMSHDYTHQSTEEDPRMMAFFDSLVQRELEGWSSDEYSTNDDDFYERMAQAQAELLEIASQPSSDDDEGSFSPFTIAFASVMSAREADNSQNRIRTVRNTLLQNSNNTSSAAAAITNTTPVTATTITTTTTTTTSTATTATTTAISKTTTATITSNSNSSNGTLATATTNSASATVSSSPSSTLLAVPLDAEITLQGPQWSSLSSRDLPMMEGQQPNSNRKSISQLIAQKRKENTTMLVAEGGHVSNVKKRICSWNPSSSDSDDDVSYPPRVRLKLKKVANQASTSTSTASATATFSSASTLLPTRTTTANTSEARAPRGSSESAQKQKALSDLKKWKELRCQISSTDYRVGEKKLAPHTVSSSSSPSPSSSSTMLSSSSFSSSLFSPQTGAVTVESGPSSSGIKVPSSSVHASETRPHKDEPELGPYLHKMDPMLLPSNIGEAANNNSENGCNSVNKILMSVSGQNSNRTSGNNNPVSGHSKVPVSRPVSSTLTGEHTRMHNHHENNNNNATIIPLSTAAMTTGISNSLANNSAAPTTSNRNSSSSEPVWTEFKRFKHRLERARCHYRQHSQSEQQSSDEDTT